MMDYRKITHLCDQALLQPAVSAALLKEAILASRNHQFASFFVASKNVRQAAAYAANVGVFIADGLDLKIKILCARKALEDGAGKIAYCIDLDPLKNRDYLALAQELQVMQKVIKLYHAEAEVCIQSEYLSKDELVKLSRLIQKYDYDAVYLTVGGKKRAELLDDITLLRLVFNRKPAIKLFGAIEKPELLFAALKAGAEHFCLTNAAELAAAVREIYA